MKEFDRSEQLKRKFYAAIFNFIAHNFENYSNPYFAALSKTSECAWLLFEKHIFIEKKYQVYFKMIFSKK